MITVLLIFLKGLVLACFFTSLIFFLDAFMKLRKAEINESSKLVYRTCGWFIITYLLGFCASVLWEASELFLLLSWIVILSAFLTICFFLGKVLLLKE